MKMNENNQQNTKRERRNETKMGRKIKEINKGRKIQGKESE
jgi:hypothetical protein